MITVAANPFRQQMVPHLRERLTRAHATSAREGPFVGKLVHNQDTLLVTDIHEVGGVGIMGRSDGIEAKPLQRADIAHDATAECGGAKRPKIMVVGYTPERCLDAIELEAEFRRELDPPNAEALRPAVQLFPKIEDLHFGRVQERRLAGPELWLRDAQNRKFQLRMV